jgi:protein-tyrosine kinase
VVTDPVAVLDGVPPPVVEAVRFLVASLQQREDEGSLPKRLGFTSAIAGEGVSYIARTVAAVMAHDLRERVCFIDLNFGTSNGVEEPTGRKGRKRRKKKGDAEASTTTTSNGPGLSDALRRSASLREILQSTDDPRLTVVVAGEATVAEAQVFAQSDELGHIIDVLERHNDRLVFDLPPVLAASATIPLARQADAIGLVVRAGVTSDTQVRLALERLAPIPSLGVVLNRASSKMPVKLQRRLSNW